MNLFTKLVLVLFLAGILSSCVSLEDKAKIALAESAIMYHNNGDAWNLVSGGTDPQYKYELSGSEIREILNLRRPVQPAPSTKIPLTRKLVNDINVKSPIRRLQYYNSTKIKMVYIKSAKDLDIDGVGTLISSRSSNMEEIHIEEYTPGVLVNSTPANDRLYICFDPSNTSLGLPFKENRDGNYYLDAEEKDGKKTIEYGGKLYEIEYENCQLVIAYKEYSDLALPRVERMPGATL
jgi:hypothetical protein